MEMRTGAANLRVRAAVIVGAAVALVVLATALGLLAVLAGSAQPSGPTTLD